MIYRFSLKTTDNKENEMPSGTTVKVFAPRIHKSNAKQVVEDSNATMEYINRRLIALAVSTPSDDHEALSMVIDNVEELLGDYRDHSNKHLLASNILDFPEDCEDELEGE